MMIVSTIEQIKAVIPNIAAEVEFLDFESYVQSAETWIDKSILGNTIYNSLSEGAEPDPVLIHLSTNVIVLKAYSIGIPFMDLIQTQNGFGVISDKNRSPASKNRVDRLIKHNEKRLDSEIEWLMNYLEDNSEFHNDWKSSPAYSLLSDCLISTSREMKRLVKFEGNRSEFLFLKPVLISQSSLFIAPTISKAYLDELIAKQNNNTLSDADKLVLPSIKQALACHVTNRTDLSYSLLSNVRNIIDKDLESYPTYSASEEKEVNDNVGFENSIENSFFVFKGF